MPQWLKAVFLIVGLGGWLVTVLVTLWRGGLPDPTTLGVPAALMLALAPPVTLGRGQGTSDETTNEAETTR